MKKHGIKIDFVDLSNLKTVEEKIKEETKLIWIETPTNPTMKICDIQAICELRNKKNKNVIVLVDNTFASLYLQSPLLLGADISLHSMSKYIGGHSDLIMGALIVNDKVLYD